MGVTAANKLVVFGSQASGLLVLGMVTSYSPWVVGGGLIMMTLILFQDGPDWGVTYFRHQVSHGLFKCIFSLFLVPSPLKSTNKTWRVSLRAWILWVVRFLMVTSLRHKRPTPTYKKWCHNHKICCNSPKNGYCNIKFKLFFSMLP